MLKPFQIIWELIEFGLQALFLYVLAIILCVGLIAYVIAGSINSLHNQRIELIQTTQPKPFIYSKTRIEEVKECTRPSGCRILEDGTIEY